MTPLGSASLFGVRSVGGAEVKDSCGASTPGGGGTTDSARGGSAPAPIGIMAKWLRSNSYSITASAQSGQTLRLERDTKRDDRQLAEK
jgi:hypothetical protein